MLISLKFIYRLLSHQQLFDLIRNMLNCLHIPVKLSSFHVQQIAFLDSKVAIIAAYGRSYSPQPPSPIPSPSSNELIIAAYGRSYSPQPPSPIPSPSSNELTRNYEKYSFSPPQSQTMPSPPPPTKPATPIGELEIGSPRNSGNISIVTDFERTPPDPTKDSYKSYKL
ncbi:hypothetical protein SADUNF_Sadunf01G0031200 [Salix dunnii]|uniref:Uncharacterized protein n=1 Tax=Salix dunnii TaxID=1413687 RepID=A0A835N9R0_9ROSI|nr:hypothetical protein SADUNF_Sadunf01G0031200 [Salix dunnii]